MMDTERIAKILRKLRGDKSREEVAEACGISVSALGMYESGNRIPRDEIKIKIARYFKRSIESIFFTHQSHETRQNKKPQRAAGKGDE